MNRYAQLQGEIEIALENYIKGEELYNKREHRDRRITAIIPEQLYEDAYHGFYVQYTATKKMSEALIASLPVEKRTYTRFEGYVPRTKDENGELPSTLEGWRAANDKKSGRTI